MCRRCHRKRYCLKEKFEWEDQWKKRTRIKYLWAKKREKVYGWIYHGIIKYKYCVNMVYLYMHIKSNVFFCLIWHLNINLSIMHIWTVIYWGKILNCVFFGGGEVKPCHCFALLIGKIIILNLNFRYLSWIRHNQILSFQSNVFIVRKWLLFTKWLQPSYPNIIRVHKKLSIYFIIILFS